MKPGNLVKTTQAGIGIPTGSIGLIVKVNKKEGINYSADEGWDAFDVFTVLMCGCKFSKRRYLARDLEVVS